MYQIANNKLLKTIAILSCSSKLELVTYQSNNFKKEIQFDSKLEKFLQDPKVPIFTTKKLIIDFEQIKKNTYDICIIRKRTMYSQLTDNILKSSVLMSLLISNQLAQNYEHNHFSYLIFKKKEKNYILNKKINKSMHLKNQRFIKKNPIANIMNSLK